MFNKNSDRFGEAVSSTLEQAVESTILNKEFTKAFFTLLQALADKLQDEWDKRAKIEIHHENYGLEYDEDTDSYTWKKSDELGNITEEGLTSNQIQNITFKLIDSEPHTSENFTEDNPENPALRITFSLKEGSDMVLYEQLDDGTATTNIAAEWGFEEVIEAVWKPLNDILPEEQLSTVADELLSKVEADIISEDIVNDLLSQLEFQVNNESTPSIESEASELLSQVETQISIEENASDLLSQIEFQVELEKPDFIVDENGEVSNNKPGKIIKREPSELVFFEEENGIAIIKTTTKEVSAANVSYQEVLSSPELSESQKSWVREKQVPIYVDTIPRQYAIKRENKEMANRR